jgi:cobalamin synthase
MTASALVCTLVLGLVSKRKIGGITGDVLGACCEISETAALLATVFQV